MLKIKDNIDLKELEKFGFKSEHGLYEKEIIYEVYFASYFVSSINKKISIATYEGEECDLDDTLYDLIQAGLVEKVEG